MDDTTTAQVDVTDDAALEVYINQLNEKMDALDPSPDTQEEWERLGEEAKALRERQRTAQAERKKQEAEVQRQHAERTKGVADVLKSFDSEAATLETKLAAPDLDPEDEPYLRARQEFVELRRSELATSLPFAGIPTDELEAKLEDAEYQREEARAKLDQALAPGGAPSAHARRYKAELDALDQDRWALTHELRSREATKANQELGRWRATVTAERELKEEDAKAISEAQDWRRDQKAEELRDSFAERLEQRIPSVEARLWKEAEGNVVRALAFPGGVEVGNAEVNRLRDAERKIEERIEQERIKEAQAQQRRGRVQPRSWPIRTRGESR